MSGGRRRRYVLHEFAHNQRRQQSLSCQHCFRTSANCSVSNVPRRRSLILLGSQITFMKWICMEVDPLLNAIGRACLLLRWQIQQLISPSKEGACTMATTAAAIILVFIATRKVVAAQVVVLASRRFGTLQMRRLATVTVNHTIRAGKRQRSVSAPNDVATNLAGLPL